MIRIRAPVAMRMTLSCRASTATAMRTTPSTIRKTGWPRTGTSLSSASMTFSLAVLVVVGADGRGDLRDGPADEVGQGLRAAGGRQVLGRDPDGGHDRRREHGRVHVALRVGASPLGDDLGQRLLGGAPGLERLA